jgi:hypothetical protein
MRLRFTIRDLLWLTLVVALATGWWVDYNHSPPIPIQPLDVLRVDSSAGIRGNYLVEPGGMISLGAGHGKIRIGGLSIKDAEAEIAKHLASAPNGPARVTIKLGGE